MVIFIWILNLVISIWNSYAVGRAWVETEHEGGIHRFMAWMGYLMAGVGFSWNIFIVVGYFMLDSGKFTPDQFSAFLSLGYVLLVPGFLFSGYAIMLESWADAYRNRTLGSMGRAAWNTYANIHNTYSAVKDVPQAVGQVAKAFTGGKKGAQGLILLLAIACLLSGFIIAGVIVWRVSASYALPKRPGA